VSSKPKNILDSIVFFTKVKRLCHPLARGAYF
jgi:hypothetical protein